ncbi:MAG: hypothetical protein ACK6CT_11810 [Planctomycetia bacterium]
MLFVAQIVCWFVVLVVLMSLIEHQVHSRLMHRQPRYFPWRAIHARRRIFTSHAIEHHNQYRRSFHDHPVPEGKDRGIRLNLREGLLESVPVSLLRACVSTTAAVMFPLIV